MFENLTNKLEGILSRLKKAPSLNETQVEAGLQEIREALLAADVSLPIVKKFIEESADQFDVILNTENYQESEIKTIQLV